MRIGLVQLPVLKLIDPYGKNWVEVARFSALLSKQILLSNLQAGGFDAQLVNLREGTDEEEFGEVVWRGMRLKKIASGRKITDLDPNEYDAWGVTCNFTLERELACLVIQHLASTGKPVVAGGSDALAKPEFFLEAGAAAVVQDKSGAANWSLFDYLLEKSPREELSGVILADGQQFRRRIRPFDPEAWPLPSVEVAQQCLGREFPSAVDKLDAMAAMFPQGAVFPDLGCDRKCDFCQTPTYKTGYKRMSPQKTLQWFKRQQEAGANAVLCYSDQFLGRVMFGEGGRQEVLEIMQGLREMKIPVSWPNGLELRKATVGRGMRPDSDPTPDEELIKALWGWDGEVGCFAAYIPAERPFANRESYAKLLPWEQHRRILKAIVRAGVPTIHYGVIVGLPDDSHEGLQHLEEAVVELHQELKSINSSLSFNVRPFAIVPIPGTPQAHNLHGSDLVRFDDPAIAGNWWTPCADTYHLSYEEVSEWQARLANTGNLMAQRYQNSQVQVTANS